MLEKDLAWSIERAWGILAESPGQACPTPPARFAALLISHSPNASR